MADKMDWVSMQMAKNHQVELLQQADHLRLVQQTVAARRNGRGFYAPMLARLGDQLVLVGSYLKGRFGARLTEQELTTPRRAEPVLR